MKLNYNEIFYFQNKFLINDINENNLNKYLVKLIFIINSNNYYIENELFYYEIKNEIYSELSNNNYKNFDLIFDFFINLTVNKYAFNYYFSENIANFFLDNFIKNIDFDVLNRLFYLLINASNYYIFLIKLDNFWKLIYYLLDQNKFINEIITISINLCNLEIFKYNDFNHFLLLTKFLYLKNYFNIFNEDNCILFLKFIEIIFLFNYDNDIEELYDLICKELNLLNFLNEVVNYNNFKFFNNIIKIITNILNLSVENNYEMFFLEIKKLIIELKFLDNDLICYDDNLLNSLINLFSVLIKHDVGEIIWGSYNNNLIIFNFILDKDLNNMDNINSVLNLVLFYSEMDYFYENQNELNKLISYILYLLTYLKFNSKNNDYKIILLKEMNRNINENNKKLFLDKINLNMLINNNKSDKEYKLVKSLEMIILN